MNKKRVMLGMSGGVDSSAAALLLQRDGYEVVGATLLLTADASADSQAVKDAAAVCETLKIEHRVYDLRKEFDRYVIRNFVSEYLSGRTPNPCIECNRHIKFGRMFELAQEADCRLLATGHYARIEERNGAAALVRSRSSKDQSYVLWRLQRDTLNKLIFPVSDYEKADLRKLVQEAKLPVYSKPDSQDICFIPDGDYAAFISERESFVSKEGDLVDTQGKVIGRHKGFLHYTYGQRKGFGGGFPEPMFVTKLKPRENLVVLGNAASCYSKELTCSQLNLLADIPKGGEVRAFVKTRYAARPALASVYADIDKQTARVVFDEPQRSITPGQSAVFYIEDMVLGGGVIN